MKWEVQKRHERRYHIVCNGAPVVKGGFSNAEQALVLCVAHNSHVEAVEKNLQTAWDALNALGEEVERYRTALML